MRNCFQFLLEGRVPLAGGMLVLGVEVVGDDVGDVGNVPSCVDVAQSGGARAREGKLCTFTSGWSCHDNFYWWLKRRNRWVVAK